MKVPPRAVQTIPEPDAAMLADPAPAEIIALLDAVRRDSRHEPQAYLDETEVPHGGE